MGKSRRQVSSDELDDILDKFLTPEKNDGVPVMGDNVEKHLEDGELLFSAQIDEAYHFRNLFEYLRVVNIDGNIRFTKDSIEYECANGIRTILNRFVIRTSDIPYYFNDVYSEVLVGINIGAFARTTKNIGKKDAFKLFMVKGINKIFYEIVTTTNSGMTTQSSGSIDVKEVDEIQINFPEFEDAPIQSMSINNFCHNCSVLANLRCTRVRIVAFKHGMKFEGIDHYDQVQNVQRFYPSKMQLIENKLDNTMSVLINKNAVDAKLGELLQTVRVPMLTIKWISKLSNISSHNDRILVHANIDKPIRLSGNIGFYGRFEIYLKNETPR